MELAEARHKMIDGQIRPNGVADEAVLAALAEVPRERFAPVGLRGVAYVDEALPLDGGRFLIEPLVLARLIEAASVGQGDRVLVVGSASGYAAAVGSRLAGNVVALESDAILAGQAGRALRELGCTNTVSVEGPLAKGCPAKGPYDAIIVAGAVEREPGHLFGQLAEGGRLATVMRPPGLAGACGQAMVWIRLGKSVSRRVIGDAMTPGLAEFAAQTEFVF